MIVITTLQELPEYCYECPCHDGDNGECQADKERRRSSEYRPYWCPLNEIRDKEIVMCKDCKKYGDNKKCPIEALINSDSKQFFAFDEIWFCADGERKIGEV